MPEQPLPLTKIVRAGFERAAAEFSERMASRGFQRTKKAIWVRLNELTAEVIEFHRHGSSYGAPRTASVSLRVHFAIRVLNDPFPAIVANGPNSDTLSWGNPKYHLRFNAETGSTFDRCVEDLVRLVVEEGEPWFARYRPVANLLTLPESPLSVTVQEHLRQAAGGAASSALAAMSLKLLGLEEKRSGLAR